MFISAVEEERNFVPAMLEKGDEKIVRERIDGEE